MFFWILNEKLNCTHLIKIKNNIVYLISTADCIDEYNIKLDKGAFGAMRYNGADTVNECQVDTD